MALLPDKFKIALRESFGTFVFLIVLFALAVVLSYVEEGLEALHRPKPLLFAAHWAFNATLLADLIVFGKLLFDVVSRIWSKKDRNNKKEDKDEG